MSQQFTRTTFTMAVIGQAWGGFQGEMEYGLTREQALGIKTLKDAQKFAGDFESLEGVTIFKAQVDTTVEEVLTL